MGYAIEVEAVLLEGWTTWDGSGIYKQPAKNIELLNGEKGSLIVDHNGISLYHQPLHVINNEIEEGECFTTFVDDIGGEEDDLLTYITPELYEQSKTIHFKMIEREATFQ